MKNIAYWNTIKIICVMVAIIMIVTPNQKALSQSTGNIDMLVEEILNNMTPEEKIGQLFMVYWSETYQLPDGLLDLISMNKVGSVLISEVNFLNGDIPSAVNRVASLTNDLQQYNWQENKINTENGQFFIPLFLAVDHEGDGARLTRIRDGMTPIPSQLSIGATWLPENAESVGKIVGSELNAIGINMLLGPVVDVLDNPNNSEGNLDIRVFGGDPQWVGEMGRAYIRGVHQGSNNEIVTVAKHFPGHGDSNRATDDAIANTGKTFQELQNVDLIPFIRVAELDENDVLGTTNALMSSHIAIESTNSEPISLYFDSNAMEGGLTQLIEQVDELDKWHENGFIVADSLGVGALRKEYGNNYDPVDIAEKAFRAGNDLLILHNVTPADGQERSADELQIEAFNQIVRIITFFNDNYEDPFYKERINESARKIIRAKLLQYPNLSLDSVLVDLTQVDNLTGTDASSEIIDRIAKQSTALIYPANDIDIPDPPSKDDNIVFVIHNFQVPSCAICGDEWIENINENIINFLLNRNFQSNKISTIYYYRDGDGPAGLSTFLYGSPELSNVFDFPDPARYPVSNDEITRINNQLISADWIVFLFAAGDCGPNSINNSSRCVIGLEESDTLDKFFWYAQYVSLDAKIAALSFGAPPWKLDSTHVNKLDVYYGIFSQIKPFHQQAICVLLRDCATLGHSPINVDAVNYNIEDQLLPDPGQTIELKVSGVPINALYVGDTIDLEVTELTDFLGNPVLDTIPIIWRGDYSNGETIEPVRSHSWSYDSNGTASFFLERPGELDFIAQIGSLKTTTVNINVLSEIIQTPTPTETPTEITTLTIPAHTPVSITQPPPTNTPSPRTSNPIATPQLTIWGEIAENFVDFIGVILTFIGVLLTSAISYLSYKNNKRKKAATKDLPKINRINDKSEHTKQLQLHTALTEGYNEAELETLCFELGNIDYDNLSGSGKSNKARELVKLLARDNRLDELTSYIKNHRAHLLPSELKNQESDNEHNNK